MPFLASREVRINTEVSDAELGYLAGIIDADGCIVFNATRGSEFGLQASMTDHNVIDWIHERFAGRVNMGQELPSGKRMKTWVLYRQADLDYLLPRLIPHLVAKRKRTSALLALVQHVLNKPTYNRPTSTVGDKERTRRREERAKWTQRREELREAVRPTR